MSTSITVQPLGSELDLEVSEQDDQVSASVEDQSETINLTVVDDDREVSLTVVPDDTDVSLNVATEDTPVSLTLDVDGTVSLTLSEVVGDRLPVALKSPTFVYNPDDTVATVTYADGTVKTFTWSAGLLTQVVTTGSIAAGGAVIATRSLFYNAEEQLVSVVDS